MWQFLYTINLSKQVLTFFIILPLEYSFNITWRFYNPQQTRICASKLQAMRKVLCETCGDTLCIQVRTLSAGQYVSSDRCRESNINPDIPGLSKDEKRLVTHKRSNQSRCRARKTKLATKKGKVTTLANAPGLHWFVLLWINWSALIGDDTNFAVDKLERFGLINSIEATFVVISFSDNQTGVGRFWILAQGGLWIRLEAVELVSRTEVSVSHRTFSWKWHFTIKYSWACDSSVTSYVPCLSQPAVHTNCKRFRWFLNQNAAIFWLPPRIILARYLFSSNRSAAM